MNSAGRLGGMGRRAGRKRGMSVGVGRILLYPLRGLCEGVRDERGVVVRA